MTSDVASEAAVLLRRVLEAVERGDLSAGTPRAIALVRRIEGAIAAFDAATLSEESVLNRQGGSRDRRREEVHADLGVVASEGIVTAGQSGEH